MFFWWLFGFLKTKMDSEREVMRQLAELSVDNLKLVHTELKLAEITSETKKDSESYIRKMIL